MSLAERVLELGGARIQYWDGGQGKPVVFFHGAGGVERHAAFIPMLAERYRVLLPSRPGFSGSTGDPQTMADVAALMADFIRAVAEPPVQLIGESAGGAPACWLAVDQPELLDKLILAAPAAFTVPSANPETLTPEERDVRLFGLSPSYISPPSAEDAAERRRNSAFHMSRWRSRDGNQDLLARLPEIKARTLILWGTADRQIPPEQGEIYQKHIPRAHLMYIYGAAHALPVAAARQFVELTTDFIERGEAFMVNRGI
ncbi:MAG TPA: alpha/beta hydrolase [Chloroflexota bacterium]